MKQRLATKLAIYTILIAIVSGLIVSGIEIQNLYRQSTEDIVATAEQMIQLTLDAAGEAVYQLDSKTANDLLSGLMQNELFLEAAIYDELGQELAKISNPRASLTGMARLFEYPVAEFDYDLPLRNGSSLSGHFTASLDVQSGLASFYDLVIINGSAQILQAIGISLLVFLIVMHLIATPVRNLARSLSEIEPGSDKRLNVSSAHENDEFGDLVNSANRYLDAASEYHAEISRQQQNLEDILDSLIEGILTVNRHGLISGSNMATENMFGYDEDQLVGVPFRKLIADSQHKTIVELIEITKAENSGNAFELLALRNDGSQFPVELSVCLTELADGPHSLWTIRDISERTQAVREQLSLEGELRESRKMEAIGTLAGGIAHDFNNMLGGIIGYTELAAQELPKDSTIRNYLDRVLLVSNQATRLVKQILTFGRRRDQNKSPLNLVGAIDECVALADRSVSSNIEFVTKYNDESITAYADETMMHQVLMNLISNAIDAIGNRAGKIVLTLDYFDGPIPEEAKKNEWWSQNTDRRQRFIRLTINDNGCGISNDAVDRIFEPFFTTKHDGAGTGMGLAVVHSIIKSHNGWIDVVSTAQGTAFNLYLPRADGIVKNNRVNREIQHRRRLGRERVLIVDDDEMIADVLSQVLAKHGYDVVTRHNAEEALVAFQAGTDGFDLVITDQSMPGNSGAELASAIISIAPDQAIILCTGFSAAIREEEALQIGVRRFIMKPISVHELCETVRSVLDDSDADWNDTTSRTDNAESINF